MAKKSEKIKHITWSEPNEITQNWTTSEKNFEYPTDYECIWGISPFVKLTERARLDLKAMKKTLKELTDLGFMTMLQSNFDEWASFKFINYDKKIVIYYGENKVTMWFEPNINNKNFIENCLNLFLKKSKAEKNNNFVMIAQGQDGLYNEDASYKAKPVKDDRFDLYYGKDFPYDKLVDFLDDEEADSLLLLHGEPGTGKSNFLQHLITQTEKTVIFIPPSMLSVISQPNFVGYMLENKNSILLIEDAEEILSSDRNSATANLLNLSDGFLKTALSIKAICTFNCEIGKIDQALLRKGRLHYKHEFKKLTREEGQELADYCNLGVTIDEKMSLAEIFNLSKVVMEEGTDQDKVIGFGNF